jgi:hypothetical protein
MPVVPPPARFVPPRTSVAALLLAALPRLSELDLPHPLAAEVIAATEVSSSRAYELKARLESQLADLVLSTGRPAKSQPAAPPPSVAGEVLDFVYRHPGCVSEPTSRCSYSDAFQLFVLDLVERHPDIELAAIASQIRIPLGTLKDWLRSPVVPSCATDSRGADTSDEPPAATRQPTGPQLETLLAEWKRWDGSFVDFCDHVRLHCGIPFGRTLIARVLD